MVLSGISWPSPVLKESPGQVLLLSGISRPSTRNVRGLLTNPSSLRYCQISPCPLLVLSGVSWPRPSNLR